MPEKKLYDLTVDPEFRDLISPLNEEELKLLEESLVADGCESPLIVWNGVIVDGHNRYAICRKHDIPFSIQEKHFDTREEVMLWMLRNQLGRRNLNSYQRSNLALKLEPLLASEAEERQGKRTDLGQNSARSSSMGRTSHKLAELAGVSHDTIKKVKKLNETVDEVTKGKLRRGDISVYKAYTELMQKEHAHETHVCERCGKEKPMSDFAIPSNRHGFSSVCRECEKEISATSKSAAEVATSSPAEPCPIPGMVMHNGAPIHVETALPDTPEMFCYVADLVKSCCDSYVIGLTSAMRRYSSGMGSEEHNAQILEMVRRTNEQVLTILNERMEEK